MRGSVLEISRDLWLLSVFVVGVFCVLVCLCTFMYFYFFLERREVRFRIFWNIFFFSGEILIFYFFFIFWLVVFRN